MATGLTEKQLKSLTERLEKDIIRQEGKKVTLKPKLVVEVGYQEMQKSPKYDSGFALRFPRLLRIREDKSPNEIDTLERIKKIYST